MNNVLDVNRYRLFFRNEYAHYMIFEWPNADVVFKNYFQRINEVSRNYLKYTQYICGVGEVQPSLTA